MDPTRGESAAEFLARADERHIAEVIRDYGEERFAVPIAKALVARRESGHPVRTTRRAFRRSWLVRSRPAKPGQDPATRTFQALRIFVNAELEELEQGLNAALAAAGAGRPAGRDQLPFARRPHRQDLHRPREQERVRPPRAVRGAAADAAAGARRASSRGRRRCAANPRARSAVMRVAERTDVPVGDEPQHEPAQRRAAARAARQQPASWCASPTTRGACSPSSTARRARSAQLDTEHERLKAETQAQATPLRVERTAREKLAMRTATPAVTQYVALPTRRRRRERSDEHRRQEGRRQGARQRAAQRAQRQLLDQPAAGVEDAAVALEVPGRAGRPRLRACCSAARSTCRSSARRSS